MSFGLFVQSAQFMGQAADKSRRHQREGAIGDLTAEKQFEDGLTP
jgi:hypothetical protein